ncbi:thioredoxin family protein [Flavobacterium sp. LS1R49]|uniref:Thioredoxin family protein n=1 Tax=Flavobacterium shii TaxID=2987687 RepID=A0A9X2ZGE5_9FLAO|nr:thioredoxin family protein [Flavobacterium shii]MCV9929317.1 thioredoxin family protein [Flavobacterium shii]
MQKSITNALTNSYSYHEYRKLVSDLLAQGKSTGAEQSEDLTHYSSLNETRMNRLEKTIKITEETISKLQNIREDYIWLVISEGWCGDAAQLLPIIYKMATESKDKIELKIVLRDENPDLMNLFLTNGGKAIPKLIIIHKEKLEVIADWGPRPKGATDLVNNYKKEFGAFDETIKTNLQLWYLHDKGVSTQDEIIEIMKKQEA